mmetsp:Transcript_1423/g.3421  ORF Transcript_1423/g.3421 Transcript_1423/m.3421 type:complete len:107 (-) Transcript_1423:37-357(-)
MTAEAASEVDGGDPSDNMRTLAKVPWRREAEIGGENPALAAAEGRIEGAAEKAEQDGAAARRQRRAEWAACLLRPEWEGGALLASCAVCMAGIPPILQASNPGTGL